MLSSDKIATGLNNLFLVILVLYFAVQLSRCAAGDPAIRRP